MKNKIKICYFLGGLTSGGIGRVTSILVNELVNNSEYEIYVLGYSKIEKEDYQIDTRIHKSYLLNQGISMTKAVLTGAVTKLKRYLEENDIDILISCGVLLSFLSISACRGLKTKCISWEHSSMFRGNKDFKLQPIIRRFAAKKSDLSVVLTNKTRTDYMNKYKLSDSKVVRIYNPVDPLAFKSTEYDCSSNLIISVGRLSYQKKFQDVILVAKNILSKYDEWKWHIYGDGEEKHTLQKMIVENNLQNKVILKGRVSNIYDIYKNYSFIVMTSRYEGFPMTLLEAAGNRLPMVSYDIETGPSEIIKDGVNGFLIPADNIDIMSQRVEELIHSSSTRIKMSDCSFDTALHFKLQEIIDEWDTVFRGLL